MTKDTIKKELPKVESLLARISLKATYWIGTPQSIVVHTIIFGIFTYLLVAGFDFNRVILIWNTTVSLEAIYLALFIQMTVNRNTQSLEEVEADIDEIQEDVEGLEDDVEDISEDLDEIQADEEVDETNHEKSQETIKQIEKQLQTLLHEVESLKTTKA